MYNWCFTWNNHGEDAIACALEKFPTCAKNYVFAEEIGAEGTPHLQGAVQFKSRVRFTWVTGLFPGLGVHWEKCKGTWKQNVAYCTKEGDWSKIHGNVPEPSRFTPGEDACLVQDYQDVVWQPWQQRIIDIIDGPVDPRKIYWYWEATGKVGKTYLAKWLCIQHQAIIGSGKQADVFHAIAKAMDPKAGGDPKHWPRLILLDIPRSMERWINYGAIEKMKDGMIYSGKYDGARILVPKPHIIIFANTPPEVSGNLSADRLVTVELLRVGMPQVVVPGQSANMI